MPKKQLRLEPDNRIAQILGAAFDLAETKGFASVTRDAVAKRAKCARGLVTLRFGDMGKLRSAVMARAIEKKSLKVIGQGIAMGDRVALTVDDATAKRALASLA